MKSRISSFYIVFILFIFFAGLTTIVLINYHKSSKEQEYFNETILSLDIAYHSSLNKYHLFTKYIFENSINNESTLNLLEKAINSKEDERRLYKGLLYRELFPLYEELKNEGVRQLHIHLKNNESFLRLHKPNKYGDNLSSARETIKVANEKNKSVRAFESGRVNAGFRNVFPINYKDKHLGSVEISVSTKSMLDSLLKLDDRREYSLVLNKSIVFPKIFETQKVLYEDSKINPNFVVEDANSSLPDSPNKLTVLANKINSKLSENKSLINAMNKGLKYAVFVEVDGEFYDASLIPMEGINKKLEGYLIAYKKSENIPIILTMGMYFYSIVILGMILIVAMIFIIKRKTETLDDQREWFKSITDGLGEGLYVMDLNAKITYVNPVACELLGYDEKEILGKNAHNLFHSHALNDNLHQKDCPIFLGAMEEEVFFSRKEYFMDSKGVHIPVSVSSRLILREDGKSEIVTSFSDIRIQKELEDKSNLLTKALESSINCIVITDTNAVIQWVNPAFENLTGYSIDEVLGKDPKNLISSGKQPKEFYTHMWETILDKKPWHGELINKKKDGTLYDEELIITPVLDEDDEIVNFIAVKQDITSRKLLAQEKEQKDKLYFQQSKMAALGEMLGNIAHQWRQPLSAISTAATGVKLQKEMNALSDEGFNNAMDLINSSTQYLSQTIEDFRGFFDPRNSEKKDFLVSNIIKRSVSIVSSQFKSKDIEVIQNIKDIEVNSYENELIQVLVNILNNSKDVLLKTEEKKFIFINSYVKKKNLIIEIKDNGGGIDEDIIDKIFEPYFTTKHKSQGTGIGLYMSLDIVENYFNGSISVSNDEYDYEGNLFKGAKFTITIDLNQ